MPEATHETTDGGPSAAPRPQGSVPAVGTRWARYLVIGDLGQGGMGIVYRAYDPALEREVALKVLRCDRLSSSGRTRLLQEARAMAKISHPNVVRVYDVEEDGDRVAIAMEHVRGPNLRDWLKRGECPWPEALELFIQAGRGLAAAHAQGLLHRDFKPANVLIGGPDDPRARVTDFGLALPSSDSTVSGAERLMDRNGRDGLMGTPWYMAPEQHRGAELTPAADQYAYCLALWEALAGQSPFSPDQLVRDKMRGPPAWASVGVPRSITRAIRRGLAPRPEDRWPDMPALLRALSPTRRRRRAQTAFVILAAVTATATVALEVGSVNAPQLCTGARQQLVGVWDEDRRSVAEAALLNTKRRFVPGVIDTLLPALDDYATRWARIHEESCTATVIDRVQPPEVLDLRMACLHDAKRALDATARVLVEADAKVAERAHRLSASLPPLARCEDREALARAVAPPADHEAEAVDLVESLRADARALRAAGRYDDAFTSLLEAQSQAKDLAYEPIRTKLDLELGRTHQAMGRYEDAARALRSSIARGLRLDQWRQARMALSELGFVTGTRLAHAPTGLAYARVAAGLVERDPEPHARAVHLSQIGSVLFAAGRHGDAEAAYREALASQEARDAPDYGLIGRTRGNLGSILHAQGRWAEAEVEYRAALEFKRRRLGEAHPSMANSLNNLAVSLYAQGKMDQGDRAMQRAIEIKQDALGPDHPVVATFRSNYAEALSKRNKHVEAQREHRAALQAREAALGPDHPDVARAHGNLASTLKRAGRLEEAVAEYRRSLELWAHTDAPATGAMFRVDLASTLADLGREDEAEAQYRLTIAEWDSMDRPNLPNMAASHVNFGRLLLAAQRYDEARGHFERAWEIVEQTQTPPDLRGASAYYLGRVLWETGQRQRGRTFVQKAVELLADAGPDGADALPAARAWLRSH